MLDYKGRCSLLVFSRSEGNKAFDEYSVGNYGIEGKEGTWKDAEDGKLSGKTLWNMAGSTVLLQTVLYLNQAPK